jgi:hypothetical protein
MLILGILMPVLAMRSNADQALYWTIAKTGIEIPRINILTSFGSLA